MTKRELLLAYAAHWQGDWGRIAAAVAAQEAPMPVSCPEKAVTFYDDDYPECFRSLRFPPWVLYYRGHLELLHTAALTIVGSRRMVPYAEEKTREIAAFLSSSLTIVSGVALGVDGTAHRAVLKAGGNTVGILGCGFDAYYPRANADLYDTLGEKGLLLSEYPPGTSPARHHFPWRNRLLAALGRAVIVTQAACRSGTMDTVSEALNLSRDVYCVPYPYGCQEGEGCNLLISQGAQILYSPQQLEDLAAAYSSTCKSEAVSLF